MSEESYSGDVRSRLLFFGCFVVHAEIRELADVRVRFSDRYQLRTVFSICNDCVSTITESLNPKPRWDRVAVWKFLWKTENQGVRYVSIVYSFMNLKIVGSNSNNSRRRTICVLPLDEDNQY